MWELLLGGGSGSRRVGEWESGSEGGSRSGRERRGERTVTNRNRSRSWGELE